MLDDATAEAVAKCVARVNPTLMQGEGAIFTQRGLELLLQTNRAFALQTIQHLCVNLHVYEDMVQELKKIKEKA